MRLETIHKRRWHFFFWVCNAWCPHDICMALKRQICLNNLPIITLIGGWILELPFEMQLDLYIGTYSWPLIPTYFMNVPLGTIQILRNQKGGWVRQNAYVCLHGGWVGVARCLRNQKITKKLFSNYFHYFFFIWGCSDLWGQHVAWGSPLWTLELFLGRMSVLSWDPYIVKVCVDKTYLCWYQLSSDIVSHKIRKNQSRKQPSI